MQNNTWRFDFLTSDLRAASYDRREYHRIWLKWWKGQKDDLLKEAKDKDITVIESFSIRKGLGFTEALSGYKISPYSSIIEIAKSTELTYGTVDGQTRTIKGSSDIVELVAQERALLERDLLEIYSRIKFHNTKMNEYNSWYNLLGNKPEVCCRSLDYDDYVFFFGEPFEYQGSV